MHSGASKVNRLKNEAKEVDIDGMANRRYRD
jgi:hypothetical protein